MNTPALTVYGSKVSYFTGKLEAYLRFKEIPYQYQPMTVEYFNRIVPEKTGAQQMPAVEFPDGRWATDTTPIIRWFEGEHGGMSVIPDDPVQAFVASLDLPEEARHALLELTPATYIGNAVDQARAIE